MPSRTIRLLIDVSESEASLIDSNTGERVFWRRGEALTFELGFLNGGRLWSPGTGTAYAIECRERNNPEYVPYFEATGLLSGTLSSLDEWHAGGYHIQATVSSVENGNTAPGIQWLSVTLSDGSDTISALAVGVVIQEPGAAAQVVGSDYTPDFFVKQSQKGAAGGVAELDVASGKVPVAQLPLSGARTIKGGWDANADSPDLSALSPTAGDYYVVTVAGTDTLTGSSEDWQVGDEAIYDGTDWHRLDLQKNGIRVFADAAARTAATPDFNDQVALQSDTGGLWKSSGTSAGDFDVSVMPSVMADYLAGAGRQAARGGGLAKSSNQLAKPRPFYLGGQITSGFPTVGEMKLLRDGITGGDHIGFPRLAYSEAKNRLVSFIRFGTHHDTPVHGHQECWVSDDLGATWRETSGGMPEVTGQDQRHTQPLFLDDGRLLAILLRKEGNNPEDFHLIQYESDDYGETITEGQTVASGDVSYRIANGANAIQIADGSILFGAYRQTAGSYEKAVLFKSEDGGDTWTEYAIGGTGSDHDWQEPFLFEADNGDVVALCRCNAGAAALGQALIRAVSTDGGETFGAGSIVMDPNGTAPDTDYVATMPGACKMPGGPVIIIHRKNGTPGAPMVSISYDEGATWEMHADVWNADNIWDGSNYHRQLEASWAVITPGLAALVNGVELYNGLLDKGDTWFATYRFGANYEGPSPSEGIQLNKGGALRPGSLVLPGYTTAERDAEFTGTIANGTEIWNNTIGCKQVYSGYWECVPGRNLSALPESASLQVFLSSLGLPAGSLSSWSPTSPDAGGAFSASGTAPVVDSDGRDPFPSVLFTDGEYVRGSASDFDFMSNGDAFTAIVSFKCPTASALYTLLDSGGLSSGARGLYLAVDNRNGSGRYDTIFCSVARVPNPKPDPDGYAHEISPGAGNVSNYVLVSDEWNVISVTNDGGGAGAGVLKVFVNGTEVATDTVDSDGYSTTNDPSFALKIGRGYLSGSDIYPFTSHIGDVLIWDTELGETQRRLVENNLLR